VDFGDHRNVFPRSTILALSFLVVALLGALRSQAGVADDLAVLSDDAFLDRIERLAFDYFWLESNPANGLIRDRSTADSKCSIAAVGFGLSGINIAVDRGWLDRGAARQRVLTTLKTLADGKQSDGSEGVIGNRGFFYHFLEMTSASRAWKCELSSIDTALFLAGAMDARQFFDTEDATEVEIRRLADSLVARVDWAWMANGGKTFSMGWLPERGFIARRWSGYCEGMILYLLALGARSETTPNELASLRGRWDAWTDSYHWSANRGQAFVEFGPLFGHQYSHCWVDFRGIADAPMKARGLSYFENSRRATLAQLDYCRLNSVKFPNYGQLEWGITACDGPSGYAARGAPPPENDDGTLAPTAAGGSLPFAPEVCLPTLRHLAGHYGDKLWGRYGYRDAFNAKANWFATDTLGIDQGPMLLMAENYRSGAVWRRMMKHPVIQRGLKRAGFGPLAGQ
jgi:hypothetical protein